MRAKASTSRKAAGMKAQPPIEPLPSASTRMREGDRPCSAPRLRPIAFYRAGNAARGLRLLPLLPLARETTLATIHLTPLRRKVQGGRRDLVVHVRDAAARGGDVFDQVAHAANGHAAFEGDYAFAHFHGHLGDIDPIFSYQAFADVFPNAFVGSAVFWVRADARTAATPAS